MNGEVVESQGSDKLSQGPEFLNGSPVLPNEQVGYDSDTLPTTEEWKTMKGYGSFITHDEANEQHVFRVNDIIHVLPTGYDPEKEVDTSDLWLAQIRSIRAHNNERVWVKAKWFYHHTELPKDVKGATGKKNRFGDLERLSSNQADFIPTSTCCGVAKITPFNEQDVEQEEIEVGTFYYRYDYDWQKRTLKNGSPPCTICKKAYNPDTDIMHFCPRQRCCRSWHTRCLANANWSIKSSIDFQQRMESLDSDWRPSAAEDGTEPRPKKKARVATSASPPADPYASIPAGLLAVARQPISRGGSLGIVGNVRSVVRARRMLQNALRGVEGIPDDWENKIGKVYDASRIGPSEEMGKGRGKGKGKGRATVLAYQCPQCGEPI